jgi:hypothetical protein
MEHQCGWQGCNRTGDFQKYIFHGAVLYLCEEHRKKLDDTYYDPRAIIFGNDWEHLTVDFLEEEK